MPPNQTTPPEGGHDPYAFIMQDQPKQKRLSLPSGNSRKQRIYIGVGLFGVLIIFGIIMLVIFTSGSGAMQPMIEIAQTQNEIIRISNKNASDIKGASTMAFAQNAYLTLTTDQKRTLDYIATGQKAPAAKVLALKQSAATDDQLETASQAGRFDEAFNQILYKQLTDYKNELASTYESATGTKQKALLKSMYENVTVLLKNQPAPTTN